MQWYVLVTGIRHPKAALAYCTQQSLHRQLWQYLWNDYQACKLARRPSITQLSMLDLHFEAVTTACLKS